MTKNEMPKVDWIPIRTKGLPWYRAVWNWLSQRRKFEFNEDWTFTLNDKTFYIPQGFVFDGASVPRPFWWLFSPTHLLWIPSIFHDWGYTHGYLLRYSGREPIRIHGDRDYFDRIFRDIGIEVNGLAPIHRFIYYILRLFAGIAWWNCRHSRKAYR